MAQATIIANLQFHTAEGIYFDRVDVKEVDNNGNYIANVDGVIKCFINGEEVPVPDVIINEKGTKYRHIKSENELYLFAKRLAEINGVHVCRKRSGGARIRVWFDSVVGEKVDSILNRAKEADGHVMEGGVTVQNLNGGEKYPQTREYLEDNYTFIEWEEEGTAIYESKGKPTMWVFCEENIFYPKWGGIDIYATPMIRMDNPNDVYGCNYIRFWGDDINLGTYEEIGIFTSGRKEFYDSVWATPVGYKDASFEPPKELLDEKVA